MTRDGWFDGQGLELHRDEFLDHHTGWQKYIADGQITAGEILEQEAKIIAMLKKVEPRLPDDLHRELTQIFLEYEVLVNMALIHYPSVLEEQGYWAIGSSR